MFTGIIEHVPSNALRIFMLWILQCGQSLFQLQLELFGRLPHDRKANVLLSNAFAGVVEISGYIR
jgi:hypothetical protein